MEQQWRLLKKAQSRCPELSEKTTAAVPSARHRVNASSPPVPQFGAFGDCFFGN